MANRIAEREQALQPTLQTVLRIALGIIIIWKSINFVRDTANAKLAIESTGIGAFSQNSEVLSFIITYLSLLCGVFITIGLVTRLASLIQLPILVVAVFFINIPRAGDEVFELILSIITLLLLIYFVIKGSGPFSADDYFRKGAAVDRESKHMVY